MLFPWVRPAAGGSVPLFPPRSRAPLDVATQCRCAALWTGELTWKCRLKPIGGWAGAWLAEGLAGVARLHELIAEQLGEGDGPEAGSATTPTATLVPLSLPRVVD